MSRADVVVSCPVFDSFRVQQVAGMFDVPLAKKCVERFSVELPTLEENWQVGLIVGPSGSGKSTIAREFYNAELYLESAWPTDRAVIDCFGELPVRQVIELFTAVGFSSPPSWIKPYHVMSCGERFRCDLAKALSKGYQPSAVNCRPENSSCQEPKASHSFRRIHKRRRSTSCQGMLDCHCQGNPQRKHPREIHRGHLSLRRGRVAGSGLGARHGDRAVRSEAASAAGDPRGSLSLPDGCLAIVCETSLFERFARAGGEMLLGALGG